MEDRVVRGKAGEGALSAEDLRELSHHLEGLALRALGAEVGSRLTPPQFRTLEALCDHSPMKARWCLRGGRQDPGRRRSSPTPAGPSYRSAPARS